ncbi:hypothetical protein CASFOL_004526 [Castilleja foliolosa]|uniref:YTH domain-containing family protein n=1 Tax=Castilleja foliolosa TaxID=1961234 RepID=A0ABD3EBG2_9LAMI
MPGEKKIGTPKLSTPSSMSDSSVKHPVKEMGKERLPANSYSSVSGVKGAIDQPLGVYYSPTSCYDYCYPGYNGTFPQSDDKGYTNTAGGSYTDTNNTPFVYYLPGYGYTSSDYLQQPYSYGSETFPSYTYDMAYTRNGSTGPDPVRSMVGPSGSGKSSGYNTAKSNNYNKALPFNSKTQQPDSSLSRSFYQDYSINPLNKSGANYYSPGLANQNLGVYTRHNPINYQSNDRTWYSDYRYRSKDNFGRNGEVRVATELTRGPRADSNKSNSSKAPSEVDERSDVAIVRNEYNSQEFQTDYDNAKMFVIKSYSEDDVHKCIKHNVWSSTPNGNKKLQAAFCEAEAKTNETGVKCPVFLFFSVNGSGQFVGVAEMIGQVDFDKNMDFWQLDKWNGFFPIKWHIIKDVPNTLLRHIILENNDNRPVTYSRDTQEIGLKQGLEMLSIFKSYSETTSVLDDFNFYENREKALKAKKNANSDHEKSITRVEKGQLGSNLRPRRTSHHSCV